ncbi:3-oxoacyl-reductase [Acaromyces ingoldii]|uniref:3-oxoacyl-reductase n=1 Tax=Acaromyces ingoldii TaxID=215250 RepID=A0A316YTN4_9BASI|nr:3-oxoacyl-reductase [Acaromyces ingoldii]PWN92581.1 3-oxoacyl-reductase [Acaromyces ingoldii]
MSDKIEPTGFSGKPRLASKVCVITGAVGGIGQATVVRFVEEGAKAVIISDLNKKACDELVEKVKANLQQLAWPGLEPITELYAIQCDVTKEEDQARLFQETLDKFGSVDVAVANAGIGSPQAPLEETSLGLFKKMFDIHTTGVWLTTKYAAKAMQVNKEGEGKGSIIINISVGGLIAESNFSPYIASKWGARGVGLALAKELGPKGIRVNNVHPGIVDTPLATDCWKPEVAQAIREASTLRRSATAVEVANAFVFLASGESSYVAGATLGVHGAMVA